MPHPDRACHRRLGSEDGKKIFQSMIDTFAGRRTAPREDEVLAPVGA